MNLGRMRLSTRHIRAVGVVALLSMLSSGFALWKLSAIQEKLETLVTDSNVRTALNSGLKAHGEALVIAIAVFKLGHGGFSTFTVAALVAAPASPKSIDRRDPDRATNVIRPASGSPAAAKAVMAARRVEAAASAGGTDDWENF